MSFLSDVRGEVSRCKRPAISNPSFSRIFKMTSHSLSQRCGQMAVGQNPVPPVNIPIPSKIGSKMGGEFTYQPKWDPNTVLHNQSVANHGQAKRWTRSLPALRRIQMTSTRPRQRRWHHHRQPLGRPPEPFWVGLVRNRRRFQWFRLVLCH